MDTFLENAKNIGWDNLVSNTKTEFKSIREELSLNIDKTDNIIPTHNIQIAKGSEEYCISPRIREEKEIKKEFLNLREALKIQAFTF